MNGITIDWSMIEWKWIITRLLAVYAAAVSTYREVSARRQWTPKVKVKLSLDIVALMESETIPHVQIWVENHGRCDMLFNSNSISVAVKGATTAWLITDPLTNVSFPYTLKPGGSFYFMKEKAPLIAALRNAHAGEASVELRAVIFDALSRPFYSEWVTVPLTEEEATT
jgi:hypothetical protein